MSQIVVRIDFPEEKLEELKNDIGLKMYHKGIIDTLEVDEPKADKHAPKFDRNRGVSLCPNCNGLVYSHFNWCPFCRCGLDWENYMGSPKGEVDE